MNVLMFGWEFPPNISGGLGTACQGILKGLSTCENIHISFVIPKAHGNEVSANNFEIVSADRININADTFTEEQVNKVSFLEVTSKLVPYLTPESFSERYTSTEYIGIQTEDSRKEIRINFSGKYGPNLFDEINNFAVVAKTIATNTQFQLIHAHDWLTFPAAIAAKHISGKPLIVHIHSTDFDRSGGSANPSIYDIEKQGMEEADQIITVSNRIKNRLIDQYNIPSSKITTIYNAIEHEPDEMITLHPRKQKHKIVTFLGRVTIQKGPEYFVEVARLIIRKMKNVHFVMAGSGEMMNNIVDLCAKYGIGNRFHFSGFLSGSDVTKMLQQSDIFIMPSVSEPFGIVPLEAMKANVPTIISLQSGVSELIRNVVKTDFWDINAMADAVYGILRHKKLSRTLIKEGQFEVSNLNWESSAKQIEQVYINTISNLAS